MAHFSRQFKRWTGMSPRKFRQSTLESEPHHTLR
ncbi:AraC family transcriptional regulator [Paenibacillus thailandensis]